MKGYFKRVNVEHYRSNNGTRILGNKPGNSELELYLEYHPKVRTTFPFDVVNSTAVVLSGFFQYLTYVIVSLSARRSSSEEPMLSPFIVDHTWPN